MTDPIREAIRDRALSSGFDAVGFAEARLDAEARDGLREFIARGYHGDMGWLAGTEARRGDPQVLWPEARTVVVLGINYAPQQDPLAAPRCSGCGRSFGVRPRARLSRHLEAPSESARALDRSALARRA